MEKNNQPLILGIVVIGAVLIISLALIFTRSDSETEVPAESTVSENEDNGAEENGESDGGKITPQPNPDPQPTPDPVPVPDPQPQPDPDPQPGILPPNWDSLTDRQKADLNPFNCDHETQWVSAEDGTCIDKGDSDSDPEVVESGTFAGIDYIIWNVEREPYCGATPGDGYYGCLDDKWEAVVRIALKGSPTSAQIAEFWSVFKADYFDRTEVVSMLGVIYGYPNFDVDNPNNFEDVIDIFFDHVEGYSGRSVYPAS